MKTKRFFAGRFRVAIMVAAILGLVGCATTKEAAAPSATVFNARGKALFSHDGTNWLAVKKGLVLVCGDRVKSDEKGFVDLLIGERYDPLLVPQNGPPAYYVRRSNFENRVRIFGLSELALDRLNKKRAGSWFNGKTDVYEIGLSLLSGNMVGNATRLPLASTHEVTFKGHTVHVEGGAYGIGSSSLVMILAGEATVSSGDKDRVPVTARHQYDIVSGKITDIPPLQITDCFPNLVPIYAPSAAPQGTPIYREPMTPHK